MAYWYGNRAKETYTYRRVTWNPGQADHMQESTDYGNVTKGSVELSAFSDLKATCSFDFEGGEAPSTTDLVRIYYSFEDDGGETEEVPIGTFFVEYGETSFTADSEQGLVASGSADGSSVLSVLINKKLGAPYTVDAGEDNVELATSIIEGLGLLTNSPASQGYTTQSPHVFEADDSWLTVVNWLLTTCTRQYQAVYPDAYGRVIVTPYVAPEKREVSVTFADDANSIMMPEVSQENGWFETPNVCRLSYQTDVECLAAAAFNQSGSKASLDSRGGRELTTTEEVTELDGATQADRIANLEAMAKQRLIDQSSEIEKVTLTHAYLKNMQPNDAIGIDYSGTLWQGNITNMQVSLEVSTPCETKIRRFVPNNLTITTQGGAVW